MKERFAAAEGDDAGFELAEEFDAMDHRIERDGLGEIVVFVAVGAGEIAAPDGDDVRHDRMIRIQRAFYHQFGFPKPPVPCSPPPLPADGCLNSAGLSNYGFGHVRDILIKT